MSKLKNSFRNVDFILDDESYFTLANTTLSGNDRFYSNSVSDTPNNVKYYFKQKYENKVLVWLAISPRGISKPFFFKSGLAINQEVYQNVLKNNLLPMINSLYTDNRYVFWPYLASAHYVSSVIQFYKKNKVNYVPKQDNPANLPQARPIEDFWAHLKQLVYHGNWQAKTAETLITKIKSCIKNIDLDFISNLANSTHKRINEIALNGVDQ